MSTLNPFELAQMKKEGELCNPFGYTQKELASMPKPKYDYTYVERRVPRDLEDEAHKLITDWLISKGIDMEEL